MPHHIATHLAWHLLCTALLCLVWDLGCLVAKGGHPTISQVIRDSWMAVPTALTVGLLIALHRHASVSLMRACL